MTLYCVGVCFTIYRMLGTLYCVGVCFTICWMLGDSVVCWFLFSGWRQCWVTLYCVGVCFQGGGSAG